MKRVIKAGIIGKGRISDELLARLSTDKFVNWQIIFIANSKKIFIHGEPATESKGLLRYSDKQFTVARNKEEDEIYNHCRDLDIVFLAISTKDDGEAAYKLLSTIAGDLKIPIVTCEKGGLGSYWPELKPCLPLIGRNASVGGGSMLMEAAKIRLDQYVSGFLAIINGTNNFYMDSVSNQKPPFQTVYEAIEMGYAEPVPAGQTPDILTVLRGETERDIPMKVSVFCNEVLNVELRANEIKVEPLTKEHVTFLNQNSGNYRHFVSFIRKGNDGFDYSPKPKIGGFEIEVDEWIIEGGFRRLSEQLFFLVIPGVGNTVVADEGENGYTVLARGLGAGRRPTVTTMIRDAYRLLGLNP